MPAYTNEQMRKKLLKAESVLRAVYKMGGPMGTRGKHLPISIYARMTRKQVDERYDFYERHIMHRIAKVLEL